MITRSQKKKFTKPIPTQSTEIHQPLTRQCRVVLENIDDKIKSLGKSENAENVRKKTSEIVSNDNSSLLPLNRSLVKITECGNKKCLLKTSFSLSFSFQSSVTKRSYDCIFPSGTTSLTCNSANIVYLLTCSTCGLQYVGETAQSLKTRFNGHRKSIKNPAKHGTCKILSGHFNNGICKNSDYSVQILEKLEGTGRTEDNALDRDSTSIRKKREDYWIRTLRTVYPYGLNDKLGDDYMRDQNSSLIGLKFYTLKRNFNRTRRRISRVGTGKFNHKTFLEELDNVLNSEIKNASNFIRMSLTNMKTTELKKLADKINDILLSSPIDFPFSQWYSIALDIIDCRVYTPPPPKKKRPPLKNVLHVDFCNKGVELVNLSSILHEKSVLETIPSIINTFSPPTIVYSLEPAIGSKIFNFNQFVSNLDVEAFISDPSSLPCDCGDSEFKDGHHGHIISGDLRIVRDNKLRKLFTKGPKYREKKFINWNVVEEKLLTAIRNCAKDWCNKHNKSIVYLKGWIALVSDKVKKKIENLKSYYKPRPCTSVLNSNGGREALHELQRRFVICPIDKAASNIAFVCKRFYAQVLIKELGLDGIDSCATYEKIFEPVTDIIDRDVKLLDENFGLKVPEENRKLPHIYWMPKLHKNPIKFRFIIAAPCCSIKPLSKAITKILKLFFRQIETYNAKSFFYSSVKTFWVIQNNADVIKCINKLNKRGSFRSMATFDFSTLYTKIPHESLLDVLNTLSDFCFKGGANDVISVSGTNARWVTKKSRAGLKFSKDQFKAALSYLMGNCYFTFGVNIFRQIIGIPMGSDPAPFMANLFLYHYEAKWIKNLKKENLQKARRFSNTFRFIDDLLTINDNNLFLENFESIYPPELKLNLESSGDRISFLDLELRNINGRLDIRLFDKRDSFNFEIVRLPFCTSNMPSTMFYSCFGAEIIRIARVSSSLENFSLAGKVLMDRALRQGGKILRLQKTLKKVYGRQQVFHSLASNVTLFLESLF